MRAIDRARLAETYAEDKEPTESDAAAALGMELPHCTALKGDILGDLTPEPPYGIGWWAPDPGTSRRILIADQLYCCIKSVESNMTEAALHRLEYLDASDRENTRLVGAVKIQNGNPTIDLPRPRSALDQLGPVFIRIHQAGLIRALASSLDCLAGVIIGVAALPMSILKADFGKTQNRLSKISGATNGARKQADLAASLASNIAASGPPGWLDWTLDLRNMLVHRGRRLEPGQFVPQTPTLLGADGQPLLRVRRVAHLPRDPGRSDIEVFLDAPWTFALSEEDLRTLDGLLGSTKALLETTAQDLRDFWAWRRRNPQNLRQPTEQWPAGRSTQRTSFDGYASGSLKLAPGMGAMPPVVAHRFAAAALDDSSRPQWTAFD